MQRQEGGYLSLKLEPAFRRLPRSDEAICSFRNEKPTSIPRQLPGVGQAATSAESRLHHKQRHNHLSFSLSIAELSSPTIEKKPSLRAEGLNKLPGPGIFRLHNIRLTATAILPPERRGLCACEETLRISTAAGRCAGVLLQFAVAASRPDRMGPGRLVQSSRMPRSKYECLRAMC